MFPPGYMDGGRAMGNGRHIGRGSSAFVLQLGSFRRAATRLTVSIGAAVLVVMATVVLALVSTVSPTVKLSADSTALIMGGTTVPTPDDASIQIVKNHFIAPTHPGQDIDYVAVTTPEELWPLTGVLRLLVSAVGPPYAGFDSPVWPDEPWWKLSGLFDLTYDQSVQAGVADLETSMAAHGNDHLVIYGISQGAVVANVEKQKIAAQYPAGTTAPNIDFVLSGDPNVPNGGLYARFPGFYIPGLDWSFNGPEPTDTPFDTTVITRQYDAFADFPLYPLNVVADLNAVLGFVYAHMYDLDVSLAPDPSTSPSTQSQHGDTTYYFFPTADLPLFGPLRTLGVPESLIDVVEPFFRVLVELGYDRSIPPWEPTPARLIPPLNPAKVIVDLVNAIGEGINNALALVGSPRLLSNPAPVTLAAPATQTAKTGMSPQVTSTDTPTQIQQATSTGAVTGTRQIATDTVTSTTKVTETAKADISPQVTMATPAHTATETTKATSTAASAVEPSARPTPEASATSALTPKPAKPAGQRAKPRPVVRDSLGVGQQLPDLPHRGNGGPPRTRTAAADAEATGEPSSTASSSAASSSAGSSSGGGSSGGDGDGS
jgi:hypothetical protein